MIVILAKSMIAIIANIRLHFKPIMKFELTKEEQNAINTLKRLEKRWPDSLWLFSANGTLLVMRKGKDGEQVHINDGACDQEYQITTINIENDGGDW